MDELIWQKYENPITVICIKETNPSHILELIKVIIENNNNEKIFNITKSADEITIIVDEQLDSFVEGYIYKEIYIGYILLNTSSFMEESGLLRKISGYFADFGIPILYITTVNNNYLFIPKEYENKTDTILKFPFFTSSMVLS